MPTPTSSPTVPTSVRIVQVVCLLQAVALLVVAGGLVVDLVSGEVVVRSTVVMLGVLYVAVAVLLVLGARAVGQGRAAVRGALITWWILAGVSVLTIGLPLAGAIAAALTCLVGVGAILWPASRAFMRYRPAR
ncbi:hypothetical protein ACPYO6_08805 [Georgenia sp. Z1344]|uniref:hypothetical protein n=1 Tax=Georgenia sp. Z1344 TaxID=3416706 RepID=UPI003CFA477E